MRSRLMALTVLAVASICRLAIGSDNFVVDPEYATFAERQRDSIARYWLGKPMPRWAKPCPITVTRGQASGVTSFAFVGGHVVGWRMQVTGPSGGHIVNNALPHEINHTVFASRFRRPLPRWLDEGAAILMESEAEHELSRRRLEANIAAGQWVRFRNIDSNKYGKTGSRLAQQYLQGFAAVEHLVRKSGPETFVRFMDEQNGGTEAALQKVYGYKSLDDFENDWAKEWQTRKGIFGCKPWG